MWPTEGKLAELRRKLSSITVEFECWREDSDQGRILRKHHSQICRITIQLEQFVSEVTALLDAMAADGNRVLVEGRMAEGMVLDIHRIWEFFRAKLGQRYVAWFRPALIAADEFAWACYQPARNAVSPAQAPADRVKEPPLVFFNGGWSPFTMFPGSAL